MSRLHRILVAIVLGAACARAVTEPADRRLELRGLQVPSTVAAGTPLVVNLGYWIGACQIVTAVTGRMSERTLEVEVRGRDAPIPPGTVCPAALFPRDTTFTTVAPSPGELAVVGLQPSGQNITEHILVVGS